MAYDDGNVFARILRGEIPCKKAFENEHALAFHDIAPQAPVHILVIPKGAYVTADEFAARASEAELAGFMRAVAAVVKEAGLEAGGYRLIVNNGGHGHQEVPHLHFHILGGRPLGRMLERA
ncbi:MAG: histidine triad nucleotide-binding protein [Alphaproteobacteria bacterium]